MSVRSVIVRLEAEVAGYIRNMRRAGDATDEVSAQVRGNEEAAKTAGTTLVAFGTTTVAALGASAKAAMDWESAWTGVTKTVDGTAGQMAELEEGLRDMAKTLPATHKDIAAVAEAAGQLGVKREDILKFTKTMVDLGETTNLTAEEAATDIAQIANVMGTTGDEIDNFGAALVALGNDGASTEKDILSMAQRIAGAGKLVGASEADVLALANTLASMGVKAELGGGVATRALLKMYAAVKDGGENLDAFASAAGTSAEDFAKAFATSPVAALEMVTKGMGAAKDAGGNVVAMLKDMGLKGTEEMQVMLALAGAGDLLSESLALGSKAWEENTALINEASKRYETTESKVTVAWNNIKDAAIDAGAVLLPIISGVAENVVTLTQAFGDLPAPVQGAVTGLGAVLGAAALVGGGVMLLLPKVRDTAGAFRELNTRADGSSRGMGKFAKAAGAAAAIMVGFEVIKSIANSMQPAAASTEEFTQALVGMANQKDSLDGMFKDIGALEFEGQINNAGEALNKLINQDFNSAGESFGATVLGIDNGMSKLTDAFDKSDKAIASAATSGNMELAAKGFKSMADSAGSQGIKIEEVAKKFPNYLNALRTMASDSKVVVSDTELLDWALGKIPPSMEKAAAGGNEAAAAIAATGAAGSAGAAGAAEIAEALAEVGVSADGTATDLVKFTDALINAGLLQLSARDAARGFEEALDTMAETLAKNGRTLDTNTEAGRANEAALDAIAGAGFRSAQAMAANGAGHEELQTNLTTTYERLMESARAFTATDEEAAALARSIMQIPPGVAIESWMSSEAKRIAEETGAAADQLNNKTVNVFVNTHKTTFEKLVGLPSSNGDGSYGQGLGVYAPAKANGGDLDMAPGPKGVDSQLFFGAKGEHVLTAQEVDMMGGQAAVYRFRAQVRQGGIPGHAAGGAVGTQAASTQIMALTQAAAPAGKAFDLGGIKIYGATDPDAVRRQVVDDIKYLFGGQGVRL